MKPGIDATEFGSITVEGAVFDHDVVISPDGEVSKRKKKLSKAVSQPADIGTGRVLSAMSARATRSASLVLAVVLAGTFMAILDVAIVNVATPSIRKDWHATFGSVELVIAAYTLTYACLLVTGGRLGDLYGRRRLFMIGPSRSPPRRQCAARRRTREC
jgi:hypothetical protein